MKMLAPFWSGHDTYHGLSMRLHAGDDPLVRFKMLSKDKQEQLSDSQAGAMSFIEESICDLVDGYVAAEDVPRGYIRYSGSLRVQQVFLHVPQLHCICCVCSALQYLWCYLCWQSCCFVTWTTINAQTQI